MMAADQPLCSACSDAVNCGKTLPVFPSILTLFKLPNLEGRKRFSLPQNLTRTFLCMVALSGATSLSSNSQVSRGTGGIGSCVIGPRRRYEVDAI